MMTRVYDEAPGLTFSSHSCQLKDCLFIHGQWCEWLAQTGLEVDTYDGQQQGMKAKMLQVLLYKEADRTVLQLTPAVAWCILIQIRCDDTGVKPMYIHNECNHSNSYIVTIR